MIGRVEAHLVVYIMTSTRREERAGKFIRFGIIFHTLLQRQIPKLLNKISIDLCIKGVFVFLINPVVQ